MKNQIIPNHCCNSFKVMKLWHEPKRTQSCINCNTKRAFEQITEGLMAGCKHLLVHVKIQAILKTQLKLKYEVVSSPLNKPHE